LSYELQWYISLQLPKAQGYDSPARILGTCISVDQGSTEVERSPCYINVRRASLHH